VRNSINILDLEQSVPMMQRGLQAIRDVAASGGRVLFVGTKRQASDCIALSAKKCGQYYVNHRWLGGMLTNWKTISNSIRRLKELEAQLQSGEELKGMTKKELLSLTRQKDKLERALGGIKEMGGVPNILFVIDTNIENISILEANKLGIPVVGIVDSNSDPRNLTFPVPGNDDAMRAIELYCELASSAVLDGLQTQMMAAGVDMGAKDKFETKPEDFGFEINDETAVAAASEPSTEASAE
jgi:small subunit ribosomal protein S2